MIDPQTEFVLSLTAAEVNVLFGALIEVPLPHRISDPLIAKLRKQILAIDPTAFDPPPAMNGVASHAPN
jgi:hypothetical protein